MKKPDDMSNAELTLYALSLILQNTTLGGEARKVYQEINKRLVQDTPST